MAEKKTNTITINDVDYTEDQLKMGRMAFMQALTASLASDTEEAEVIN